MTLALIAAMSTPSRVIGNKGELPWHFSKDLAYFKEKTMGASVVMGRKTYQSILKRLKKPLPGRRSLVLTKDPSFYDDRVTVLHHEDEILPYATSNTELFIIGGSSLYQTFLPKAERIYLTQIMAEYEGDAFFPKFDPDKFCLSHEHIEVEDGTTLHFDTFERSASR